jgi:hypothetical protein
MVVDPNNIDSLKKFFDENPSLTTYELAILVGKSPSTIRNWKRKCNIQLKESPFNTKRIYEPIKLEHVTDANIWDNEEWFRQKYHTEGLGIPTIAKIISKSVSLVANRLTKYEITTRSHADAVKSDNICCNEEWLYKHYATHSQYVEWCDNNAKATEQDGGKAYSLTKCAELAKVVPYTIYNWLVHFRVPMRDISEAMTGENNPFYGRKHTETTKQKIKDAYWKTRNASGQEHSGEGQDPGSSPTA